MYNHTSHCYIKHFLIESKFNNICKRYFQNVLKKILQTDDKQKFTVLINQQNV